MPNPYVILGVVAFFLVSVGGAYMKGHSDGADKIQGKYDLFVAETKALGAKAEADKVIKEKKDADQITAAVAGRDTAIRRLRELEKARASVSRVPLTPAAAQGSSYQCFEPKALSAAVERYRGRVRNFVTQGDEAAIDAAALIQAWPK